MGRSYITRERYLDSLTPWRGYYQITDMKTKTCKKCNIDKELSEFYKDPHNKDRLKNQCRSCKNKYVRDHWVAKKAGTWTNTRNQAKHQYPIQSYNKSAKNRGQDWKLSDQEAEVLFQSNCHYCDRPPSNVHYTKKYYSGIDRVDNTLGYVQGNVVACCKECNLAKHTRSADQFIDHCKRVATYNSHLPKMEELDMLGLGIVPC